MTYIYKRLLLLLVFCAMSILKLQANATPHLNPTGKINSYPSLQSEGLIGVTEESPIDNPVDNIFHVNISESLCGNEKIWLTYELEGVADHTSVSRSINDQVSVGGYLVKRRRGWAVQREQISAVWLKEGDNVVRFTMPENALHSYRIRNLKIEVEPSEVNTEEFQVIFNQPSTHYFFDKAYIKGIVTGAEEIVRINIDGKAARMFNGEFESVIDFESAEQSCVVEVEAVYADGSTTCHSVSFTEPQSIDFTYSLENYTYKKEQFFWGKESQSITLNGAALVTSKGALINAAALSITTLRAVDIAPLDAGMENVTKHHAGFRFLPHGTVFNKEVDIRIPFDAEKIPDGYTEADIRTYYFDEQSHHWVPLKLDTVLVETSEVLSKTLHFTDYINAIIKVPESPEADAYNSTSMKGIKAANPTAAVNLINPPQANNTGNASLGYPINIPAGRAGMQPQLSITYNSGGGNGWMGLGWNLTMPSISIDTRWGVPRYDPDKETETYTLNGEMLTPVAHKGPLRNRVRADEQFFPRIEGAFNKIIRHGNDPTQYWWEVIDKNGTRYSYGGRNKAFDPSSVLRTKENGADGDKGNIAQWCLREVTDINGNTVVYHYVKISDVGVAGGSVNGYQIYIDRITYTGHQGAEGRYVVQFIRESSRPDKIITANLGFKQVTGDRLKRIEIKFNDINSIENIRAYELEYKTGAFFKSLVASLKEFDSKNALFTVHTFGYYDEVKAGSGYQPFFAEKKYNTFLDDINGGFLNKSLSFNDKASMLSGTQSENIGGGLAVTIGPNDQNLSTKSNTAGISYSYAHSKSEGRILMLDVNGDGLADKVMMFKSGKNKILKYRPQIRNSNGIIQFSSIARPINGISEFLKETSSAHDFGIESHFGVFAGLNYTITKSKTSNYFTDANGDGLIDMVSGGKVLFNRLDANGDPTFSDVSAGTPNPIIRQGNLDANLVTVNPDEVQLLKDRNPLHDVVRMWRAPFDGIVNVTAPVALLKDTSEERQAYTTADGVRLSVQLKDNVKWVQEIKPDDYTSKIPTGLSNISVKKNDRIYFRVHSIEDGSYDKVSWSPIVEYVEHNDTIRDANNKPVYQFNSGEDFLVAANQTIGVPIKGKIRIESVFVKPVTSDSLTVEVIQIKNSISTVLFSKKFDDQQTAQQTISLDASVDEGDRFQFKVTSSSNIRWTDLKWRPILYYTVSEDPNVTDIKDEFGNPLIKTYPVPQYSLYSETWKKTLAWRSPKKDTIEVAPFLDFKHYINLSKRDITLTVKKKDSLMAKFILEVNDTMITDKSTQTAPATVKLGVKKGDKLYFEYATSDLITANNLHKTQASVKFISDDEDAVHVDAGLYSSLATANGIFGPLHRNWGLFSYNGNGENGNFPLDESKLNVNKFNEEPPSVDLSNATSEEDMNNTFESSGGHRADKEAFVLMYAEGGKQRWMGNDDFVYINVDTLSSSRMGLDQISSLLPELTQEAGKAFAVDKITKSNQTSLAVSGGPVGVNGSTGNSRVITDYMDMNGDKYPDLLGEYRIQYTLPEGGLEAESKSHGWEFGHRTQLLSGGVSAGGSFAKSGKEASGSPNKSTFSSIGEATSLNVSALWSKDDAQYTWLDINADGLPDRVNVEGGKVSLNLGYSFAPEEGWGIFDIRKGSAESFAGGLGVNIKNHSISAGIGYSRSDNTLKETLQDVNGDGLPDKVVVDTNVTIYFNTGNGFVSTPVVWGSINELSKGAATSWSANVAFTIGIPLIPPAPVVKLAINPKVNYSRGFNRQKIQLSDVDGDGYPDYLVSDNDGELKVSSSTIGCTNLLKEVRRPLGASFTLKYERIGNTYQMSNSVWALNAVKLFDGFKGDGADSTLTTFSYEDGIHDRLEREFYGFKNVITKTHDTEKEAKPVYTKVMQTFANDNYYEKGLLLAEIMTDGSDNRFVEKENIYKLKDITNGSDLQPSIKTDSRGSAFPALVETRQKFYEGQSSPGKTTSMSYGYDVKGNVITYDDFGDEGEEDNLSASIVYHALDNLYLIGTPKSVVVTGSGKTYRKRESVIDPNTGNIIQIKQFLSDNEISTHDMEYDTYGNLKKITRPKNAKDQRLSIEYFYDDRVQTYPVKVSNSYGYFSEATYDFRFGQKLTGKDLNGNEISYELDDKGRVAKITGPYEKGGSGYSIKLEYHPEAIVPWALTRHFDPSDPKNDLLTSIFADGLGRVLQTKKDVAIYEGEGKADTEMMAVSGRVKFDAFGRPVSVLYPITEPVGTPGDFNLTEDKVNPTLSTYDVLNRTLTVTLPDLAVTKTAYGFETDREGKKQFSTKTTDANGKQTEQFTDVRGRVTSVKNYTSDKAIWTSFKYNAINEQIEATDDLGHTTFSVYDNFGRRTERRHPDAGITTYSYDLAGNLTELATANLAKEGLAILYTYDFERLTNITYPQNPENNVKYSYGETGASDNRAGRIVLQEDATGAQEFFYGPLGEVVKNIRTIVIPQHDEQTYTTEWAYDTWNRLTSMTYADGEKVAYTYNSGGLLRSMTGKKKSASFNYVNQLGYDKFEQRLFLAYGNGTKTSYAYEPDRRRLKNMTAQTAAKRLFIDNVYTYDKVNNILSLENKAPIPSANLMGGASEYNYEYDDLYRLTSAEGLYKGSNDQHAYTLSMSYNNVGGITQKTQVHKRKDQEQKKTTYDVVYSYGETQPHAPKHIGDQTYTFDANGNQTGWTSDVSGQRRLILWDEENRIRSIYDNGSQHHYVYDASGERVLKGKSTGQRIFVNGQWKAGSGQMGNYTVYVNPYLVLKSGGYTKHYYVQGQRIVSKLGGGWDNHGKGPLKAGGSTIDYARKTQKVFDGIVKNLKFLGADGQILTAGKSGKIPPGQINGPGSVTESFEYFYHPDHLGSTGYVTDATGEVFQHLEYFAYGETLLEEHSNTDRTPFLFNGKELDEETGLYYYGARYYDPTNSIFESVDRFAEKYPGLTPYNYTAGNPIKYTDPSGDTIVVNKYGYITRNDKTDNLVYSQGKDGKLQHLGEVGGNIDATGIYANLLERNAEEADDIWDPTTFRDKVKNKGDWDYKNNMKTIYGLANHSKGKQTIFQFDGKQMTAEDIGNHHFGVVGKAYGLFTEDLMLQKAGEAQIKAGTSKPEWQKYEERKVYMDRSGRPTTIKIPLPPYGDDPNDQMWIKHGFDYYKRKLD